MNTRPVAFSPLEEFVTSQHARVPCENAVFLLLSTIAYSATTLNYDIKFPVDMDTKQFRGIKVPYKSTNSVSPVRRGK